MSQEKIKAVQEWPTPKSVKDIQAFLGFSNFCRRFIKNFSAIITPITRLLRKNSNSQWTEECQGAFEALKKAFTSHPVLIHPNSEEAFTVETDASDYAIGCVLSQRSREDGRLHPCAFYSRSMSAAEQNYDIHDKELLAVKTALEQWRHYLEGARFPVTVYTDHKNLEHFATARSLNQRQIRWSMFFSRFDFVMVYRPGIRAGKPDALSRRSDYKEAIGGKLPPSGTILRPNNLRISSTKLATNESLVSRLKTRLQDDPFAVAVIRQMTGTGDGKQELRRDIKMFSVRNGILLRGNQIYVPEGPLRLELLQIHHDSRLAGHFGRKKTLDLISREYWWPSMAKFVHTYVESCDTWSSKELKTPTLWAATAAANASKGMVFDLDGFYHRPPELTRTHLYLGGRGPPDKDGTLCPMQGSPERGRASHDVSATHLPSAWSPGRHSLGQRHAVYFSILEKISGTPWHQERAINGLPSTD